MEDALHDAPKQPDVASACAAAILAPAIAAAVAAFVGSLSTGFFAIGAALVAFIYAVVIAMLHVMLLGLPSYLLVRRWTAPGWLLCGACGFVLGAVPFLLIARVSGGRLDDGLWVALFLAFMGLIGGLSFRWKLKPDARRLENIFN